MPVHEPTFFTSPVKGTGVRGIELKASYSGELKDGKRHGFGLYCYPNGMKYEGQYSQGMKQGEQC